MKTLNEMIQLFETANKSFLKDDYELFESGVAEPALCGALQTHINRIIYDNEDYLGYYADVEYNRNNGKIKTILNDDLKTITIKCDLILHSRGHRPEQDNLIAIEMKKSTRPDADKAKDRNRLRALTKDIFDDVWSFNGKTLPEHVCKYVLGVYYEINYARKSILIEYYSKGNIIKKYMIDLRTII